MYCGFSLGRVGADFRGLIPELFLEDILRCFQLDMDKAVRVFSSSLRAYEWHINREDLARLGIPIDSNVNILEYPPLAILCNDFLQAFNALGSLLSTSQSLRAASCNAAC